MKLSRFLAAFALVFFTALAFAALPTVDMVQAEVQRGNYAQAEQMMREVVTAKPGSARAHYIYAEILAHNKRFEQAALQASLARQADPAIKFADPAKVSAFESLLDREQRAAAAPRANPVQPSVVPAMQAPRQVARPAPEPQSSGIPSWIWVVGLCAVGYFAWRMLQNSRRQTMMAAPAGGQFGGAMVPAQGGMAPMGGGGYGPGGPGYGQAPSAGSGLMGVGLGVAGGVAAGMLAEKLLHGGDHGNSNAGGNYGQSNPAVGGGGGFFDDAAPANYNPAAQELEQRPVDFGNGDGWGGGDAGGGGGGGGGDGGGDGGW